MSKMKSFKKGSKLYLKGLRIISSVEVLIPKCKVLTLAEMKKRIVTVKMDIKISIQEGGSKSFRRFQVGDILAGYLLNQ